MPLLFPSNPTNGQTTTTGGRTWTYNGTGWTTPLASGGGSGGASVTVSNSAPATTTIGSLWLNDNTGEMTAYYGGTWADFLTGGGSGGSGGAVVTVSSTSPVGQLEGALWLDQDTGDLSIFLGNNWIGITTSGSAGEMGATGPIGITGATGVQGPIGPQGATGVQGNIGLTGSTGIQGNIGPQGATGIQGNIGLQGATGVQGATGTAGTIGSTGATGATGLVSSAETLSTLTTSSGVVPHSYSVSTIWHHSSMAGNITANFTNVPTTTNQVITFVLFFYQGATPYAVTGVQIEGVAQTVNWFDNIAPTGTANKKEIYSFSLVRVNSAWTVHGTMSSFG